MALYNFSIRCFLSFAPAAISAVMLTLLTVMVVRLSISGPRRPAACRRRRIRNLHVSEVNQERKDSRQRYYQHISGRI